MKDDEFKAEYKKAKRKVYFKFISISVVVSAVLTALLFFIVFHGYDVPKSSLFDIVLPIPLHLIESFSAGTICLSAGLIILFGKSEMKKNISDSFFKKALKKIDREIKEFTEESKTMPAGILFLILGIIAIGMLSIKNVGFSDNGIRFSDSHNIIVVTAEYSDFELYKLDGYYNDNGGVSNYRNAYGIVNADGKSYDFGNVSDEFEVMLLSKYHHSFRNAETIDDAINEMKNK